jgi:putative transposase
MARRAVAQRGLSIRVVCQVFRVSQSCYCNEAQTTAENEEIASWLLLLTDNHRS